MARHFLSEPGEQMLKGGTEYSSKLIVQVIEVYIVSHQMWLAVLGLTSENCR